jgi:hypothetical protein
MAVTSFFSLAAYNDLFPTNGTSDAAAAVVAPT